MTAREYWDNQWTQSVLRPRAVAGIEPYAARLAADPDEPIEIWTEDEIKLVVAGGETQGAFKMFGGAKGGIACDPATMSRSELDAVTRARITSYNVCYTKLLRSRY